MALDANYLKLAGAHHWGRWMLGGVAASLLAVTLGAAFGKFGVSVLAATIGTSCLYGALIYGYRTWRVHYVYWHAAGLTDEQIRQKWRDLYDEGN